MVRICGHHMYDSTHAHITTTTVELEGSMMQHSLEVSLLQLRLSMCSHVQH